MVVSINGGVRYPIGVVPYTGVNYPTFRGTNVVSSDNVLEKNSSVDTVEISSKEEKKKGLSTGAKWGIGLISTALAIYGSVVAHRAITRPTLEKTAESLSEIFGREIGTGEAKTLLSEYKKLFKIKDTKEFYDEAFKQVKKDYGLEKADISLLKMYADYSKDKYELGSWLDRLGAVSIKVPFSRGAERTLLKSEKLDAISTLIHELKHAKQSALVSRLPDETLRDFATQNFERYRKKRIERFKKEINEATKLKGNDSERAEMLSNVLKNFKTNYTTEHYCEELIKDSRRAFKPLKLKNLEKDSPEYKQAMEYLKVQENYISGLDDYNKYRAQLIE